MRSTVFEDDDVVEDVFSYLKARMDAEGLPYAERTHTYNSRMAQELGCWADTVPGGDALHDALFRAYFVERSNLAEESVLLDTVAACGLSTAEAGEALASRRFKDQVDADWELSRRYGVTGVPTFVAGGAGVVGAQPYEAIAQLLTSEAGAELRS